VVVSSIRARCHGLLFSLAVSSAFCRFFLRNQCLWTLFLRVSAEAVVSAILIFSVDALSVTLHLMAELADFSDVCTSAVFICGSCRCRWNPYGSECRDISEELSSAVCISLSTDTEILSVLLLLETSAFALSIDTCRSLAVAVVKINRPSADKARAWWRLGSAAGGALMTVSAASLPLGAADR